MIYLENNLRSEEEKQRAIQDHLKEEEKNRIDSELAVSKSSKETWRKRNSRWANNKSSKVLLRLPIQQLQ